MNSFTCSTEMVEFLDVRTATWDHMLPQVLARGLQSYLCPAALAGSTPEETSIILRKSTIYTR